MKKSTSMIIYLVLALSLMSLSGAAQTVKVKTQTNSGGPATVKKLPAKPIDINSATEKQLASLPGVGPRTAKRIIAARPFKSVQELKKVKGIGDKKYNMLKSHVVCEAKKSK